MYIIIVACLLLVVDAAVLPGDVQAETYGYENTNDGSGNYKFSFYASNGMSRQETGRLVNVGESNEHIVVEGSYSYVDTDGKTVNVRYTADENGYHVYETTPSNLPSTGVEFALPASAVATLLGK